MMGCQSKTLKPDSVPLEHSYHSAEIILNNESYIGLAVAKAEMNRPFLFEVRGIKSGKILVESDSCDIHESRTYKDFEEVPFLVTPRKACVVAISIFPEFTEQEANKNIWRHFTGVLTLWPTKNDLIWETGQFSGTEKSLIEFDLETSAYYSFEGCGLDEFTGYMEKGKYKYYFPFNTSKKVCIAHGFIHGVKLSADAVVLVSKYSELFEKLPIPSITFTNRTVKILADPSVSFMEHDSKIYWGNKVEFSKKNLHKKLRGFTSGGRSFICELDSEVVKCQR